MRRLLLVILALLTTGLPMLASALAFSASGNSCHQNDPDTAVHPTACCHGVHDNAAGDGSAPIDISCSVPCVCAGVPASGEISSGTVSTSTSVCSACDKRVVSTDLPPPFRPPIG